MYYEFTMTYTNGKVSCPSIERQELSDQLSYCNEGIRSGWLLSYNYESIKEEY